MSELWPHPGQAASHAMAQSPCCGATEDDSASAVPLCVEVHIVSLQEGILYPIFFHTFPSLVAFL